MKIPVALQLYSVREEAKANLPDVLDAVSQFGYDGVEFAGLFDYDPVAVRDRLGQLGLKCCGAHVKWEAFDDEALKKTLKTYRSLGCKTLIVPWLPEAMRNTPAACLETAAAFSRVYEQVVDAGFRFGFHCHEDDMKPLSDGLSAWDTIASNTPQDFILQYDTANGMAAGIDPAEPIRQWAGRSQVLHLKAYGDGTKQLTGHAGQGQAVIGSDDIDWKTVLHAAKEVGGTEWYVIEQEQHPTMNAMDAAKACREGLQAYLVG